LRRCSTTPTAVWSSSRRRPASSSGDRKSIEERALPFRPEEEVLVTIEEPHMYNADDAIARIDSYIICVSGAADWVGERRMVRIESVERASAVASLLPDAEQPERSQPKKKNESGNGRGGGRGGSRGRSRSRKPAAKAASGSESGGEKDDPDGGGTPDSTVEATQPPASDPAATAADASPAGTGAPAEKRADEPDGDKSVNSRRFGLRRGRRRRGRGPDSNAGS
jgi:ribonuclease G